MLNGIIPHTYHMMFKIYTSGDSVYIISKQYPQCIVSINMSSIEMITLSEDSFVIHSANAHIVLLNGNIITQIFDNRPITENIN